jgi:hypothetical protein
VRQAIFDAVAQRGARRPEERADACLRVVSRGDRKERERFAG